MRTVAQETASQRALRNCFEDVGGRLVYTYDFSEERMHAVKHTFWQKVAASHEEQRSP